MDGGGAVWRVVAVASLLSCLYVVGQANGISASAEKNVIIVACGNAFGPCTSNSPVKQMQAIVAGLPVTVVGLTWGGKKWEGALAQGVSLLKSVAQRFPNSKVDQSSILHQ